MKTALLALAALLAAVPLAACGGGSSSSAGSMTGTTTTSTVAANPSGKVAFKLGRCLGDPNGQLVCTDGEGLTMPAPTAGSHDDADSCTWGVRGRGLKAVYLCHADG